METNKPPLRDCSRVMRFPIAAEIMLDLFRKGQVVRAEIVDGLPDDSQILRHHYDNDTGMYFLTVQSNEFEPVPKGKVIPIFVCTVKNILPAEDDYKRGYHDGYQAAIEFVASGETPKPVPEAAVPA